jgi:hypothetical protein
LDPGSIQWGANSHTCTRTLSGAGLLKFIFAGILLPDSNVNEAASHGFVSFRIKPFEPVLPGTIIENIANIYFDFNDPVITEPSVLVAEFSTDVAVEEQGHIVVAPNPVNNGVRISMPGGFIHQVRLFTMDGRPIMFQGARGESITLDVGMLTAGVYLVELTVAGGSDAAEVRKLVRTRITKQ